MPSSQGNRMANNPTSPDFSNSVTQIDPGTVQKYEQPKYQQQLQDTPDQLKSYNKLLSHRLDSIHWWKDDPTTAAWLTGSSLPEHHIEQVANHLPNINNWVNDQMG